MITSRCIKTLCYSLFLCTSLLNILEAKSIVGQIFDKNSGEKLYGANVYIKNTSTGVVADDNGVFNIHANNNDTIIVTYMGYESYNIVVNDDLQEIKIYLSPTVSSLGEIVVSSSLGIKRASREIGTANKIIDNEQINQAKVINPILGLSSKVSGLRINMFDSKVDPDVQVVLRGIRSHNGDNSPLYVVDGVPIPDINRLNPNDIESITILKGANAAALYGSEGVNGALIITTKKGQKGKQRINYSNTTYFEKVGRMPEQQTQYGNGLNGGFIGNQYESWGAKYNDSMVQMGGELPDGTVWTIPYSNVEDGRRSFFNTGVTTQNDLSISGGDEKSSYLISIQDVVTKGIIPEDKNRKTGVRLNTSRKFGKLTTGFNINYVFNNNNVTPSEPWSQVYRMPSHIKASDLANWREDFYANPNYYYTANQANPYFNISNQRTVTKQQTLNGKIDLDYKVTDWLNIIYRVGLYNRNTDTRATVGKFVYQTPGRTNIAGSVNDNIANFRRLNSDFIIQAEKQFSQFSTRLILGNNIRDDKTKSVGLSSTALVVPDLYNQGNRTGNLGGTSALSDYRQVAWFGEFTGGYNNFLFLTVTGRQESVSVLSKENRSYFYPGASVSFILNEAIPKLKHSNILTFSKFYMSYNKTANVSVSPYQLQTIYSQTNGFPFGNLAGFSLGTTDANPNLKPEFVRTFEAGTQLSFFKNRLNLEMAYVVSKTTDGIIQADLSGATGYTSAWVNAFSMQNNILELDLSGDIIRNSNMKWTLGGNFTWIKSNVKEIFGDIERLYHFRQNYLIKDQPYNYFLFTDYKRDPEGRIIVDKNTGNPVGVSELKEGGTGTPPFQLGFHTHFEYKRFFVGAQFDWRLGAVVYSEAASRMIQDGTSPLTSTLR